MADALAEVALLGLGWQLAFLGMMVQPPTVVAPSTKQDGTVEKGVEIRSLSLTEDTWALDAIFHFMSTWKY